MVILILMLITVVFSKYVISVGKGNNNIMNKTRQHKFVKIPYNKLIPIVNKVSIFSNT